MSQPSPPEGGFPYDLADELHGRVELLSLLIAHCGTLAASAAEGAAPEEPSVSVTYRDVTVLLPAGVLARPDPADVVADMAGMLQAQIAAQIEAIYEIASHLNDHVLGRRAAAASARAAPEPQEVRNERHP